jgi:hypothetical protein
VLVLAQLRQREHHLRGRLSGSGLDGRQHTARVRGPGRRDLPRQRQRRLAAPGDGELIAVDDRVELRGERVEQSGDRGDYQERRDRTPA